ncbi:hypothetical protein JHK85_006638 [Glycine max]|nr:hypothetical protein JHK85_006638 [Glycine max]
MRRQQFVGSSLKGLDARLKEIRGYLDLKILEIGKIGYSTEVELVLRENKAGKLSGKKN